MPKPSRRLDLPKRILKVKNYENLTVSELIKEINRLEPIKKSKKIAFEKYKGDDIELKRRDIRKSFRLKKENKDIIGKKEVLRKLDKKKIIKK